MITHNLSLLVVVVVVVVVVVIVSTEWHDLEKLVWIFLALTICSTVYCIDSVVGCHIAIVRELKWVARINACPRVLQAREGVLLRRE